MMFVVQLDDGKVGYTRDGSFKTLNGMVITGDGKPVLGAGGGPMEASDNEPLIPAIAKVDYVAIKPQGDNIFITKNTEELPIVDDAKEYIMQGALESSNVNIVKSMTSLITAHRSYEQMSKLMSSIDEINTKAASEVGNVKG